MIEAATGFPETTFVHVMDREFDSIGHFRAWHAQGHRFLVRAKWNRRVRWRDRAVELKEIHQQLLAEDGFWFVKTVQARGGSAELRVAETEVILDRPAKRRSGGRKGRVRQVRGEPLSLRLIIAEICMAEGTSECWLLYSNVSSHDVDTETLALWYYWRWRIESFFKLLKSAGVEVESWKQRRGEAILKRLLLAAMALCVVYRLSQATGKKAATSRQMLIKLSGRMMRHKVEHTIPALLAGLYMLLQVRSALEAWTRKELDDVHDQVIGRPPPKP
jgi:hypothetical protein